VQRRTDNCPLVFIQPKFLGFDLEKMLAKKSSRGRIRFGFPDLVSGRRGSVRIPRGRRFAVLTFWQVHSTYARVEPSFGLEGSRRDVVPRDSPQGDAKSRVADGVFASKLPRVDRIVISLCRVFCQRNYFMNCLKNMLAVLFVASTSLVAQGQTYRVLHTFKTSEGGQPSSAVTVSGSTIYGVTTTGGTYGSGTLFSLGANGSGFQVLHSFAGGSNDGATPAGDLTLVGSTLYGTSELGGGYGNIYSINTDGSNVQVLHTFDGSGGVFPLGALTRVGSTFYGTTEGGSGDCQNGTVFKMQMDGSGFSTLHAFSNTNPNGIYPSPNVAVSGSTLYGTTQVSDNVGGGGLVFKINLENNSFSALRKMDGVGVGNILLSGSTIFGADNWGQLFKINTDGTGYKVLHTFDTSSGGNYPCGDMVLVGSTLYGTTSSGSYSYSNGSVFQIKTDGTGFKNLHTFTGGTDGRQPWGGLTFDGSALYGMTAAGGSSGQGILYSITVPEPSTLALLAMGAISLLVCAWKRRTPR
jgi:uncharacterized repeat protein (TIGR03803 family)